MSDFRSRARQIVRTAHQLTALRGSAIVAFVLEKAQATLINTGYDAYGGGVDYYTLTLELPVSAYVSVEDQRSALEKVILQLVQDIVRADSGSHITEVVISPQLAEDDATSPTAAEPSAATPPGFWAPGHFRLFLSHPSAFKRGVHEIKAAMASYQVAAFVAHDDIEPTTEWQAEIESALRTMDALAAVLTPDTLSSKWCDQEVGIAIGRGKLVVPLRAGADPYGFLGKYQGLTVERVPAEEIAARVFEILVRHELTSARMCDSLIERLETAHSSDSAKKTMTLLERVPRLNSAQMARLAGTVNTNSEVEKAFGVPDRISALIKRVGDGGAT